ncbi:response regulator transcription factor [Candidatus Ozemobacteraceae bacterium]|nr:response regulator transcription factor [Candidatus Ozemobacteraceae bacterium]
MREFRIVLADDHRMFRECLKNFIESSEGLRVIAEASDGKQLTDMLKRVPCDMVITDIAMPEMDGLVALREIRQQYPDVPVLILSMFTDFEHFEQAKALGAAGFLTKSDASDEALLAIQVIRAGKMYVSPAVTRLLGERQIQSMNQPGAPSVELLTKREKQIMTLIARGKTSRCIADELSISRFTVENHRANMMRKLHLTNAVGLLRFALEKGLA